MDEEVIQGIGEQVPNHPDIVLSRRTMKKIFANVEKPPENITPLEDLTHIERHWGEDVKGSKFENN